MNWGPRSALQEVSQIDKWSGYRMNSVVRGQMDRQPMDQWMDEKEGRGHKPLVTLHCSGKSHSNYDTTLQPELLITK